VLGSPEGNILSVLDAEGPALVADRKDFEEIVLLVRGNSKQVCPLMHEPSKSGPLPQDFSVTRGSPVCAFRCEQSEGEECERGGESLPPRLATLTGEEWPSLRLSSLDCAISRAGGAATIHRGPSLRGSFSSLESYDITGRKAFLALFYRKLNAVAFVQRAKPFPRDVGIVHKDVILALAGDKPIAFSVVEPLDEPCFLLHGLHVSSKL